MPYQSNRFRSIGSAKVYTLKLVGLTQKDERIANFHNFQLRYKLDNTDSESRLFSRLRQLIFTRIEKQQEELAREELIDVASVAIEKVQREAISR